MAKKISDLTPATAAAGANEFEINESGTSKKLTMTLIESYLNTNLDFQAQDDNLDDISGLSTTDGGFIVGDGTNFVLESGATARASLGIVNQTDEEIEDIVGAMVSDNTETLITVTYQDADGTIDFVVDGDLSNYNNDAGFLTSVNNGNWSGTELSEINGGTGQGTYTTGDILYSDGSNSLARLAIGTEDQVLTVASGVPAWEDASSASVPDASTTTKGIAELATATEAQTGTDATRIITPDTLHATMLGGVDQSRTDVTASRSTGTTYTNSTGRPIEVIISILGNTTHTVLIDGTAMVDFQDSAGNYSSVTFTVQNGSTYRLNSSGTLSKWSELR